MGCWNETCFVSNLPIFYKEPIYLFFTAIEKRHRHGPSLTSPHSFEGPISLPISGSYNDYGGIESVDTGSVSVKLFGSLFSSLSFDDIYNAVSDRMDQNFPLQYKQYQVSCVLVRKDIFDYLTDKNIDQIKKWDGGITSSRLKNIIKLLALKEGSVKGDISELVEDALASTGLFYPESFLDFNNNILLDYFKTVPASQRQMVIDQYIDLYFRYKSFCLGLESIRKSWSPGSGAGSHDSGLFNHLEFHNKVSAILKTLIPKHTTPEEIYEDLLK